MKIKKCRLKRKNKKWKKKHEKEQQELIGATNKEIIARRNHKPYELADIMQLLMGQ